MTIEFDRNYLELSLNLLVLGAFKSVYVHRAARLYDRCYRMYVLLL